MDVQQLQREKRELTMQLDREQNEKQELFLQVIRHIPKIQTQLNNDVHSLQEELRRKSLEMDSAKEDAKQRLAFVEEEKSKLQENVETLQQDLEMKAAALQSMKLAKQVTPLKGFYHVTANDFVYRVQFRHVSRSDLR
ncbi:unnamed protein product [Anisakis simplex]|uniref:Growth arrest-specific protein 8 n=1 Tax=Anisakis simplex TaxID=6269 RepID=A0A0M3J1K8_ANISI|nr:unnamed protein product [Anisakis simplex]